MLSIATEKTSSTIVHLIWTSNTTSWDLRLETWYTYSTTYFWSQIISHLALRIIRFVLCCLYMFEVRSTTYIAQLIQPTTDIFIFYKINHNLFSLRPNGNFSFLLPCSSSFIFKLLPQLHCKFSVKNAKQKIYYTISCTKQKGSRKGPLKNTKYQVSSTSHFQPNITNYKQMWKSYSV